MVILKKKSRLRGKKESSPKLVILRYHHNIYILLQSTKTRVQKTSRYQFNLQSEVKALWSYESLTSIGILGVYVAWRVMGLFKETLKVQLDPSGICRGSKKSIILKTKNKQWKLILLWSIIDNKKFKGRWGNCHQLTTLVAYSKETALVQRGLITLLT